MSQSYKKFNKKFELPNLKIKVQKIIGQELDNTTYSRVSIYNSYIKYKLNEIKLK